ncbi:MAG: fructosamine kinase family protein [Treponema sp.]|nr:fructosamine kinase family protein [Treponema sp.]
MNITLPANYDSLALALTSLFGMSVSVRQADRISGGDINKAYRLTLSTGDRVFMKANEKGNAGFFTAEAAGLTAIAMTDTVRTPRILCTGTDDGEEAGYSFLLLGYIESAGKRKDYWETFARELAAMHRADTKELTGGKEFGFFQDNYIGARPQGNTPESSWVSFFREQRLAPQFRAADHYFDSTDRKKITRLLDHLGDFLVEPEAPSLLHGDLWGGNVMCGRDGKAMLIDPACYVGHAEADIAMTELFGGFPRTFYDAYREANPPQGSVADYEGRRDLYNLYQLLNHLNLFGSSYLHPVLSIVEEYAG